MKKISFFAASLYLIFSLQSTNAQGTFDLIYTIFQNKCANACHNINSPDGQLNLAEDSSTVYANLVGKMPVNPVAAAKGHTRIEPGYPHQSFLLRKVNNNLDPDNGISEDEGNGMPKNTAPLKDEEIELIRQWILHGAPIKGNVVDTSLINTYYRKGGINDMPVAPPPPVEGFQIHVGKFFLSPAEEAEYYIKHDLHLDDTIEIDRVEVLMPPASHHFLLYRFNPGYENEFPAGLRNEDQVSHITVTPIGELQISDTIILPAGTAYQFSGGTVFDLNYHIANNSKDSILVADFYINFYTKPKGTAAKVMYSKFIPNFYIEIPQDSLKHIFTSTYREPEATHMWDIWAIATHTHRYGVDYDVYKRRSSGEKGEQSYEGFYDFNYKFNQGYYDWKTPPIRFFEPFLSVNPHEGLIHEAAYINTAGPDPVRFGLTSKDEMMVMGFQYTIGEPITAEGMEEHPITNPVIVFPNPFTERSEISYELQRDSKVKVEVYSLIGEKVKILTDEQQPQGKQMLVMPSEELLSGIYFLKTMINESVYTSKLLKME